MITNIYEPATLEDTFEYGGRWWLPERPEEQVRGTIRFDRGQELLLTFSGHLGNLNPNVVYGHCSGVECKLLNANYFSHSSSRGEITSTVLSGRSLLVGGSLHASSSSRFASLRISYSNMESWLAQFPFQKTFNFPEERKLEFCFECPQPREYSVPAIPAKVRIEHHLPYSVGTSFQIEHRCYIVVVPDDPREVEQYETLALTLQGALSLLSGYACKLRETLLFREPYHGGDAGIPTRLYAARAFRSDIISTGSLQVQFSDIEEEIGNVLQKWFEISESHRPVYGPLLGTIFNPAPYADTEFLSVVHALEGFHRREFQGLVVDAEQFDSHLREIASSLPPTLPTKLRSAILQKLQYGNERSLRSRLKELIASLPAPMRDAICKDSKQLVSEIANMRNDLVHRPLEADMGVDAGQRLITLMLKGRALLTMLMLQRIGVPSSALANAIRLEPFAFS